MQSWVMEQPFNFNKGSVSGSSSLQVWKIIRHNKSSSSGPLGQGQNVCGDQAVTMGRGVEAPIATIKFCFRDTKPKVSRMPELKTRIKPNRSQAMHMRKRTWSGSKRRQETLQNETRNTRCEAIFHDIVITILTFTFKRPPFGQWAHQSPLWCHQGHVHYVSDLQPVLPWFCQTCSRFCEESDSAGSLVHEGGATHYIHYNSFFYY